MKTAMLSSVLVTLVASALVVCRAVPVQPPFEDEKAENDSQDINEVGPNEDWKLYNQISKTQSYDSADEEKTKRLMKEIEEFTRLVSTPQPPPPQTYNIADNGPDGTTLENEPETETEHDYASSDWFASTWRTQLQNRNNDGMLGRQEDGDAPDDDEDVGNVEEIIKKIRKDLKKLYKKLKEVVKVVKNWYAIWSIANTVIVASSG
ncbi:Hypothetical protein CINCED_3A011336 [Cinara cedri]|uniref:Uncharacterized protein n=1 Tax=Cinara cedri TaxID=506608 RepID=A0A5E4N5L5_9HEMI|nr:Hypothetical protein CINCED_3A011336 [Cinara cedri]